MQLKRLNIVDFRQFYGESEIEFGKGQKNTTLIVGVNGAGKTGIFRAVMFALYGDHSLDQDTRTKNIHLVNLNKLHSQGLPVKASVKLDFEHNGNSFSIRRSITEFEDNGKIRAAGEEASLSEISSETGETTVLASNSEDVNTRITEILPRNVRNFFFFDAEKLQLLSDLSTSNSTASTKVKKGVSDLLQINTLNEASKILSDSYEDQRRNIAQNAGSQELEELENALSDLNEKISDLSTERENIQRSIEESEKEINSVEIELKQNVESQTLNTQINSKRELLENEENSLSDLIGITKDSLVNYSEILATDTVKKADIVVQDIQSKQNDQFTKQIIKQSLDNGVCLLCGNDLKSHPENERHIKELLNNFQSSQISGVLGIVRSTIDSLQESSGSNAEKMRNNYSKIYEHSKRVDELEREIEQLESQVTVAPSVLKNLNEKQANTLPALRRKREDFLLQQKRVEDQINSASKEKDELSSKRDQVSVLNDQLKVDVRVADKTKTILSELNSIVNSYVESSKTELQTQIKKIFNELISNQDKALIDNVLISDNFDLQITNSNGVNLLSDISMGQSQMLSLAFITALATVASKGRDTIDFPLFMDTPFGRLSSENRAGLIRSIPSLTSQWILLLTDTELTSREKEEFISEGHVNSIYRLDKDDQGKTTISQEKESGEF